MAGQAPPRQSSRHRGTPLGRLLQAAREYCACLEELGALKNLDPRSATDLDSVKAARGYLRRDLAKLKRSMLAAYRAERGPGA